MAADNVINNTNEKDYVKISVMGKGGTTFEFRIKNQRPMARLMRAYCEKSDLQSTTIRFSFDRARVQPDDTAEGLNMEDGDGIEVFKEMIEGLNKNEEPDMPYLREHEPANKTSPPSKHQ